MTGVSELLCRPRPPITAAGSTGRPLGILADIRDTLGVELAIDVLFEAELSAAILAAHVGAARGEPCGA
jgi:hypothetical protein